MTLSRTAGAVHPVSMIKQKNSRPVTRTAGGMEKNNNMKKKTRY